MAQTLDITYGGKSHTFTPEEAARFFREVVSPTPTVNDRLKAAVRLGVLLAAARDRVPNGAWGRWVARAGIPMKTVTRRIRLAVLAGADGELDPARLAGVVNIWNVTNPTRKFDAADMSVYQAEQALGVRGGAR